MYNSTDLDNASRGCVAGLFLFGMACAAVAVLLWKLGEWLFSHLVVTWR